MLFKNFYIKNLILLLVIYFYPLEIKANEEISNYNSLLSVNDLDRKKEPIQIDEYFVLEKDIDPEQYILGPGDKIGISITTSSDILSFIEPYITIITPTGDVWIPDIGSINISGETIQNAEEHIIKFIKKNKLKSADVSMVLLDVRKFKIQVVGAVLNPDFVTISSIERLTVALGKSGGLHKLADEDNIKIIRKDKSEINCSLKLYNFNGDLDNNPILKDGDVIMVPFVDSIIMDNVMTYKNNQIYVTGFVVTPSGHIYIPGYNVIEYIAMSGGVTMNGNLSSILIYRNGKAFPYDDTFLLMPGDEINVKSNLKYQIFGEMSILEAITALMTLFLTYTAAIN